MLWQEVVGGSNSNGWVHKAEFEKTECLKYLYLPGTHTGTFFEWGPLIFSLIQRLTGYIKTCAPIGGKHRLHLPGNFINYITAYPNIHLIQRAIIYYIYIILRDSIISDYFIIKWKIFRWKFHPKFLMKLDEDERLELIKYVEDEYGIFLENLQLECIMLFEY